MSDVLAQHRKAAAKLARAATSLTDAIKELETAEKHLEDRPFAVAPAVAAVRKALAPISELSDGLTGLTGQLTPLEDAGKNATVAGRARLAAQLDDALRQYGLSLKGRLPSPSVGPLTLDFIFGGKPAVKVYYGPKVTHLETLVLDPMKIAAAVSSILTSLETESFDERAYLGELHTAWQIATIRLGLSIGDRVPIREVHRALAAGRQPSRVFEPSAKGIVEYGAVRFSHDLARLKVRRAEFGELALTVATREQTKNIADHLWVDGTHYAFISFR